MESRTQFLEVRSFEVEEEERDVSQYAGPLVSPFVSLYESDEAGSPVDPEAEAYAAFLNELHDPEMFAALTNLVREAAALHESRFTGELADPGEGYGAERFLEQHFAPLVAEAEAMIGALARELGQRDPNTLTEEEVEAVVDQYQPVHAVSPNTEEFLGKLKKVVKKVASVAGKLGLGPILAKVKLLIQPLLKKVIGVAIGKLPTELQPSARKLAEKLGFMKPSGKDVEPPSEAGGEPGEIARVQYEFEQNVANVLFAQSVAEQDLFIAEVHTDQQTPSRYPFADLDRARAEFLEGVGRLREGEDPTPLVQEFVPAILPALRMGIKLIGRKNVINFLAKLVGKLIQKFVGPENTPALSKAIVDAGLRLIRMEVTPEVESEAAASAVAGTIEETVRRVAEMPDFVLDNQELLEGFALEAFEQAAAANLPQVLPQDVYRKRPDLGEARSLRGAWVMQGGPHKRWKEFSRAIPTKITPHKVSALNTLDGTALSEFLESEFGIAPGEEVEAIAHLYELMPSPYLPEVAGEGTDASRLGALDGQRLQPLTREAAALLFGEPELGRDAESGGSVDPRTTMVGQRFFHLEIPGRRPLTVPGPHGRAEPRRRTDVRLTLDFPKNAIVIRLFLSEIRAQEIAVKLRSNAHRGVVTAKLRGIIGRGLENALTGSFGRLKIIHDVVTPDRWGDAMKRLPSLVPRVLCGRLDEWLIKGLADYFKPHADEFIKAVENTADGVTMIFTFRNPPGFPRLRDALRGKSLAIGDLRIEGSPDISIRCIPGHGER